MPLSYNEDLQFRVIWMKGYSIDLIVDTLHIANNYSIQHCLEPRNDVLTTCKAIR